MVPRYTTLPIIAIILKIMAWTILFAAFLSSAFLLVVGSDSAAAAAMAGEARSLLRSPFLHGHLVPAFVHLLGGSLLALLVMAVADGIHVLLDIEENTRRVADLAAGEPAQSTPPRRTP